jgi:hypothetical protein
MVCSGASESPKITYRRPNSKAVSRRAIRYYPDYRFGAKERGIEHNNPTHVTNTPWLPLSLYISPVATTA